jgi:hypothetical protein
MVTRVVFKKISWFNESGNPIVEVNALFPEMFEGGDCILSYAHIGQHSEINEDFLIDGDVYKHKVETATEEEYKDLKKELESIGYELEILT